MSDMHTTTQSPTTSQEVIDLIADADAILRKAGDDDLCLTGQSTDDNPDWELHVTEDSLSWPPASDGLPLTLIESLSRRLRRPSIELIDWADLQGAGIGCSGFHVTTRP